MKCRYTLVFMAAVAWSTVSGQQNVHEQLERMSILEQQGQPDKIIETVPRLIDSNALDRGEVGRAWLLLGSAFQDKADYGQSLSAYRKALKIYSQAPIDQRGYARVMDDLADLYQETGEIKIAISVEHKSLAVFKKMSDHAGITRSSIHMASLDLAQHNVHNGKRDLARAMKETQQMAEIDDDVSASLLSNRAWIAEIKGNFNAATVDYEKALYFWKRKYGEQNSLTGWGYMLLGKACSEAGQLSVAAVNMRKGIDILGHSVGPGNPRYLVAELGYSQLLDRLGEHAEAARLRESAQTSLANVYRNQCSDCRIDVAALR
jgi:tetratricopeptide (TPR) repeat protein